MMAHLFLRSKFPLGQIVGTPGALGALATNAQTPLEFLVKHANCDWGELDDYDKKANELALKHGERVLSVYKLRDGARLYIITEADRSVTTLLLPEEY